MNPRGPEIGPLGALLSLGATSSLQHWMIKAKLPDVRSSHLPGTRGSRITSLHALVTTWAALTSLFSLLSFKSASSPAFFLQNP